MNQDSGRERLLTVSACRLTTGTEGREGRVPISSPKTGLRPESAPPALTHYLQENR